MTYADFKLLIGETQRYGSKRNSRDNFSNNFKKFINFSVDIKMFIQANSQLTYSFDEPYIRIVLKKYVYLERDLVINGDNKNSPMKPSNRFFSQIFINFCKL